MTVGQRIAQKRKELGLSQEALGEQLGVSRQAIYKWESDATLPEIEKLIALSRTFHVSVGWLLGEEEGVCGDSAELTEQQLRMVQEIVDRYLSAQPSGDEPEPTDLRGWLTRHRVPLAAAAAAALAVVLILTNLFDRLDTLDSRYRNLQGSLTNINASVNGQINSIANRVESILQSQNALTAEYSASLKELDLAANTVTFTARAVPRTYRDGMTGLLSVRSGGERTEQPIPIGPGSAFEGEITCPLTDEIELSVIFVSDGQRQTQLLEEWTGLYSGSFPYVHFPSSPLWFDTDYRGGDLLNPGRAQVEIRGEYMEHTAYIKGGELTITDIKVGLFRDDRLLFWYKEELLPVYINNVQHMELFYLREQEVTMERGHAYTEAALLTDQYGRQWVCADDRLEYDSQEQAWRRTTPLVGSENPDNWNFDPLPTS